MYQIGVIVLLGVLMLYGLKRVIFNIPVKEKTALVIFHTLIGTLIILSALVYSLVFYMLV